MTLFEDYRRQQLEKEAPLAARIVYAVFDKDRLVIVGRVARHSKRTYEGEGELF